MLQTQGIVAPVVHAATAHLLPVTIVVAGTLLVLKVVAAGSWYNHRQKRKDTSAKQTELEQKLADLQNQYESLKEAQQVAEQKQQPAKTGSAVTQTVSGKYALFEQIINENIAIRKAANA
ncbi:hypothetical protein [Thiothrix nivea]|uniref:Uncharacterized protein n=1 Tax=Thiothrix nivea (strain ATCC 35100 / DSM 5205 / JP2) TaxID=870187 RepID=A0A656HK26_THINJ|nr:hypothetical protein [Thiothrix nivea]EIJ36827.1 hypothetical protein Thini_4346 [Thiothrix nivea DSM 5205]